jgi:hypothetical protein
VFCLLVGAKSRVEREEILEYWLPSSGTQLQEVRGCDNGPNVRVDLRVVLGAVLASQASLVVGITVGAVWVDPEEVDVGRGDTDKEAEAVDRRSHGCG